MLAFRWLTTANFVLTCIGKSGGDPQKQPVCLARDWREAEAPLEWPTCVETRWDRWPNSEVTTAPTPASQSNLKVISGPSSISVSITVETVSASSPAEQELDTESPLDNVNFLSFEDWKKQNLAKAGQSAENIGGNRRAGTAEKERRRPAGINNALDSLGDDVEIELDFGGFGADASEAAKTATAWGAHVPSREGDGTQVIPGTGRDMVVEASGQSVLHAGGERSKDAGTTCKERFNYASFDCAATVLKTNREAKGSSSVLIENKDSYMLNECRAQNKFLILELCDDILVDTVVLANYEFFSSIFHTFRVSVADRYPAKPEQWKELGIYEATNTREIQAFAVENPLIWARYLRIEFLTHYGHEFYCPLSLIRVHGTTMLEEYKHDGEVNKIEEEVAGGVAEPAPETGTVTEDATKTEMPPPEAPGFHVDNAEIRPPGTCPDFITTVELVLLGSVDFQRCGIHDASEQSPATDGTIKPALGKASSTLVSASAGDAANVAALEAGDKKILASPDINTPSTADTAFNAVLSETDSHNATSDPETGSTAASKVEQSAESIRATATQPLSANPTTQESFFKSVNKRLQMLETNSSLSLQYIEEQSRILRDAFNKVEKRQLLKTSTFLENLNVTVVNELKQFREQYEQTWRSVALEFEHQRIQYHQEIHSLSAQLGVLADEIVFQKRVAVIQSIMVLLCFGLVLFTRGAAGGYIDLPSVQNIVSRSYSLRPSSPILGFGSPPGSPGSTRPTSSYHTTPDYRRQMPQDLHDGSVSPTMYAPSIPISDERGTTPSSPEEARSALDAAPPLLRSNSSPPDLNGEDDEEENDGGVNSRTPKMNSTPLAARSPNTHLAVSNEQDLKAASTIIDPMDYHRQKLQGKIENQEKQQASYVSPSDDIMSPCSKKLSDLKGKRFKKYVNMLLSHPIFSSFFLLFQVEEFVEKECIPAEALFSAQLGTGEQRWKTNPAVMEELKTKAKKIGLWNMFLPKSHFSQGAGFSNLEYGLMAEYLGKSKVASEATNNAAPDTGNMEVLAKYGNDQQKAQWLMPLLDGKIRSAFLMTEPDIASSDATNIQLDIRREGNEYVLNGSKWWSSGAGDPRCQIYLVMGKTDPRNPDTYKQQSVLLVPASTPGITIHRMLSVYGYDDAPHGHGHITFKNVRVPLSAMILGEGRGFEIIQGRLGPGRIHHAMRTIGAAERAIDWLIARINDERKKPFGQPLSSQGVILEWLAKSRIEVDAARLIVLNAAIKIDQGNAKFALKEIAQAKVLVPQTALMVIDRAVQVYGAAGVSQDTPLAYLWAMVRTLRIADGPDEVHLQQLGKKENKSRREEVMKRVAWQKEQSEKILTANGFSRMKSPL
ncbi:hypothetical protein BDW66DRAFT_156805 [Aspergillus desertorum]